MTPPAPADAALSPDLLAHRYDPGHDAVHLVQADRATRAAAAFLTDANLPGAAHPLVVRRGEALAAAARGPRARTAFVFHSAYCCSTLVANAYDRPGRSFSLKEPVLLNDLVGWRHRGADPALLGPRLDDALALLARPFAAGEVCVVKPSNVVNGLAPALVGARPDAGVLLLHAPLPVYLGSIASKGLWGRRWVRDLLFKQLIDGTVELGFERTDYFLHTDLQVAAVGWLAQHMLFTRLAKTFPDRVRTLDSEVLLARPTDALAAADALFGVRDDAAGIGAVIASVFRRDAKSGTSFSADDRAAGQRDSAALHREELDTVLAWAGKVAEAAGLGLALPHPLLA